MLSVAQIYDTKTIKRFWSKVDKNGSVPEHMPHLGQCWIWTGCKNAYGYGKLTIMGVGKAAHRVSCEIANGRTNGYVCHHCDNPPCVNPSHLFVGSQLDNMRDAKRKNRLAPSELIRHCGEDNGRSKITIADVLSIRLMIESGEKFVDIADVFNITPGMVGHIAHGSSWGLPPITPPRTCGWTGFGVTHSQAKLSELDVIAIRKMREGGESVDVLSAMFNISRSHTWDIIKRKYWKHI
jgi:hypothetical protein